MPTNVHIGDTVKDVSLHHVCNAFVSMLLFLNYYWKIFFFSFDLSHILQVLISAKPRPQIQVDSISSINLSVNTYIIHVRWRWNHVLSLLQHCLSQRQSLMGYVESLPPDNVVLHVAPRRTQNVSCRTGRCLVVVIWSAEGIIVPEVGLLVVVVVRNLIWRIRPPTQNHSILGACGLLIGVDLEWSSHDHRARNVIHIDITQSVDCTLTGSTYRHLVAYLRGETALVLTSSE